jgi:hypothetical protein
MPRPSRRCSWLFLGPALLALAGALAASSCYSPTIQDGTLSCAGGNRCPRGFVCRVEVHLCYRSEADAGGADVAPTGEHDGTIDEAVAGGADARDAAPETPAADTASDVRAGDRGLGAACDTDTQCASGVCADGVCCQSTCDGMCEACNLKDSPGTCMPVAAGMASPNGHPACATAPAESCDRDGTCDGNRGCRLRRAGTACGTSSCANGMTTPAPTCDGLGECRPSVARPCAPYACNGNGGCFESCTTGSQCQAPNTCAAGSCGPRSNGSTCAQASDCASQHCVDGVCCNEACAERCKACDVGGSPGTCTQVASGPPHGMRTPCTGNGTCAGTCTSASATGCTYPGDEVTCRSASCAGAMFTARVGCNAAGSCAMPETTACGDFACNAAGTACLSACTADNQCVTSARPYCDGGACVSGRSNGARCQTAGECAGGRCVDGFCCNDTCQLPCQACDVAGHAGTCWPVANGTPYGGRAACGGAGDCAGYCNALSSGQCFFPGSDKACACPGGIAGGTCNGAGHCQTIAAICL